MCNVSPWISSIHFYFQKFLVGMVHVYVQYCLRSFAHWHVWTARVECMNCLWEERDEAMQFAKETLGSWTKTQVENLPQSNGWKTDNNSLHCMVVSLLFCWKELVCHILKLSFCVTNIGDLSAKRAVRERGGGEGVCAQFTAIKYGKSWIMVINFQVSWFTENNIIDEEFQCK